eukprot:14724101-Ditylum_brightwellii.AAC.1
MTLQLDIDKLLNKIQGEGMIFNVENNTAVFLGVSVQKVLSLEDATAVKTPSEVTSLGKDLCATVNPASNMRCPDELASLAI